MNELVEHIETQKKFENREYSSLTHQGSPNIQARGDIASQLSSNSKAQKIQVQVLLNDEQINLTTAFAEKTESLSEFQKKLLN